MSIKSGYSIKNSVEEIVQDIKKQLEESDPKFILFFSSPQHEPEKLSQKMKTTFPHAEIIGCTTAGEITSGKMLKNSVVAMGFEDNIIADVHISVLEDLKSERSFSNSINRLESSLGKKISDLDYKQYIGVILIDGIEGSEEMVMERLGSITDIPFIGGSAGDNLNFKKTDVCYNDKSYSKAAVLALIKPKVGFDVLKTQSFKILDQQLIATKVDEEKRMVLEFNGKPAVQEYAKALGVDTDKVSSRFMHNPVGLIVNNEPYVRSPKLTEGNNLVFYCNIKEGTKLSLLESENIVEDTKKALDKKKKELGDISAIINFHCILRTLELEEKNQVESYGNLFKDTPTIGFSTYGEEYLGHVNQTSTMLVFKSN